MSRKPNILFLLNDHQAYYGHGTMSGAPEIRRPHFERLAQGGVEFDRAYSVCPLCGPARRSMLTGLYPHNHGELRNDAKHPFERQTYLEVLANNGYRNDYYGKWHAGPGTAHDHRCNGFSYPSYNNPYTKPEYKEYLKTLGLPEPQVRIERSFAPHLKSESGEVLSSGDLYTQNRPWSLNFEHDKY